MLNNSPKTSSIGTRSPAQHDRAAVSSWLFSTLKHHVLALRLHTRCSPPQSSRPRPCRSPSSSIRIYKCDLAVSLDVNDTHVLAPIAADRFCRSRPAGLVLRLGTLEEGQVGDGRVAFGIETGRWCIRVELKVAAKIELEIFQSVLSFYYHARISDSLARRFDSCSECCSAYATR
jgi:hypothetical protein